MKSIVEMIAEISAAIESYNGDELVDHIDQYVDSLQYFELVYALTEYGWEELAMFMAVNPIPMACCGFHYMQHLIKLIIVFEYLRDLRNVDLTLNSNESSEVNS